MEKSKEDNIKLWSDILDTIKVDVSEANYNTWFKQTFLYSLTSHDDRYVAEVGCLSSFIKTHLESRYFGYIQDILTKFLGKPCDTVFLVKTKDVEDIEKVNEKETPLFGGIQINKEELDEKVRSRGLRVGYTFNNFAVSSSNQMAWAAAEAVSKELGSTYNPLFIWGGVGVGKTHLMNAVGIKAIEENVTDKIILCSGEQFTNDIVEGIRNKSTSKVREKYRKSKILLIDDVQFIAGKDAVQEEFFHTFNALVNNGSQVILTSDKPPSEIAKLEDRLKSRFEAGLIVDIAPSDFELRCAIVQIKSMERKLNIPSDLVHVIAGNIDTARKIEGFLIRLISETKTNNLPITENLILTLLNKKSSDEKTKASPPDIIDAITKYYTIGKRNLLGSSRVRTLARPRQILMYFLRTQLGLPLEEVGRVVGGRDHTTVMHAVDKITVLASEDVQTREDIRGIKNLL
jgi:chromosomal replication initiator protein